MQSYWIDFFLLLLKFKTELLVSVQLFGTINNFYVDIYCIQLLWEQWMWWWGSSYISSNTSLFKTKYFMFVNRYSNES